MKNYIFYLLIALFIFSCESNNRTVRNIDTNAATCIEPPAEFNTKEVSAKIDASVPQIKQEINGSATIEKKVERIREVLSGTTSFEIIEYRLCVAVSQGRITKEQYNELIKEILPQFAKPKNIEIKIKVVDENGEPLPGATIIIEGTDYGASTDFDGKATLSIPYAKDTKEVKLQASYIGYTTKTETVKLNSYSESIDIQM